MSIELPAPPVPADCDCTDLDGFLLNVERLMASELVALSSHEVVAAALFLWCRAWKQRPAASLPDDDRVNAAFARLTLARYRKIKTEVLRGFVKCADGRLYHGVLAQEASRAFGRKIAFRRRRETDADRLRRWRQERDDETPSETPPETRFDTRSVAEGKGQGQGQGHKKEKDLLTEVQKEIPDGDGEAASTGPPSGHAKPAKYRWPPDRIVPDDWIAEAAALDPSPDGYAEAERFQAYWTEGKGRMTARDEHGWHRTWQNWLAKARPGPPNWRDRYGWQPWMPRALEGAAAQ